MSQLINLDKEWEIYYPKVYGYFFRRVNNRLDIEDLTSLVLNDFFKVLTDETKSQKVTNKNGYLWKIAYNYLADFIKLKSKKPLIVSYEENFEVQNQALEKFETQEFKQKISNLKECVKNSLKDLDFKIVSMCILEQQTSKEAAKLLGLSSDNVRQKLSRALKKLKVACRQIWQN
jgi:RNA polymerase sigma factor (sigma-70 family)